jgi:hypothetical protein
MPEEVYEMTRSQSEASNSTDRPSGTYDGREEEARLLNKESDSEEEDDEELEEDEEWAIIVDENGVESTQEYEKVKQKLHLFIHSKLIFNSLG